MKENRLWYTAPAKKWEQALPLGNGVLGMMVFGGVAEDRVQLNEETFWSGWERTGFDDPATKEHIPEIRSLLFSGRFTEAQALCNRYLRCRGQGDGEAEGAFGSYQTAGELLISLPAAQGGNYTRELFLDRGLAVVQCGGAQREYFVSPTYNAAVIRIFGQTQGAALRYQRHGASILQTQNEISAEGYLPTKYALLFRVREEAGALCVYFTAATAYQTQKDPAEACRETLERAMAAGADALQADTAAYFGGLLGRAHLTLPGSGKKANVPTNRRLRSPARDTGLYELYFNFGRYLLAASSRGRLPANLQGIWCRDYLAPWSADYHVNINIQMNYWFAETCDLPELITPFFNLLRQMAAHGEETARTVYGCPGWVCHFTTNPWGYTSLGRSPVYGAFAAAGAWCLRHVKERWLYGGDTEFLRSFYPVLRGASAFFLAYLVKDPNTGYLVTAPSGSPENSYIDPATGSRVNVCAGPTMDTSILRELFSFHIAAAEALGMNDTLLPAVREALGRLTPLRVGKYGQIMEWPQDHEEAEPGHRHMSHLYGLYPGNEITESIPEAFAAAKKTIERRLANGGGHTGWSRAWIVNFYARLQNGEAAYENLAALLEKCTLPNLFDTHPPFQIDGNFGGTAGIAEMLLQSHNGFVDILPAAPAAWGSGEFSGFKARGGLSVSAAWENGRVVRCSVKGRPGQRFTVRVNGETRSAEGEFTL